VQRGLIQALGVHLQHLSNVMSFAAQVHSGAASSSPVALAMAARRPNTSLHLTHKGRRHGLGGIGHQRPLWSGELGVGHQVRIAALFTQRA